MSDNGHTIESSLFFSGFKAVVCGAPPQIDFSGVLSSLNVTVKVFDFFLVKKPTAVTGGCVFYLLLLLKRFTNSSGTGIKLPDCLKDTVKLRAE